MGGYPFMQCGVDCICGNTYLKIVSIKYLCRYGQ